MDTEQQEAGDVSVWEERARVIWVRHHQSRQDLRLIIVGRIDQVEAISQDSIGGRAQEYKVLQVAQRHIT